jgi:hypothetical protein
VTHGQVVGAGEGQCFEIVVALACLRRIKRREQKTKNIRLQHGNLYFISDGIHRIKDKRCFGQDLADIH